MSLRLLYYINFCCCLIPMKSVSILFWGDYIINGYFAEIRPVTPPEEERVGNTEHVKSEPVNGEEAELRTIKVGNPDLLSRLFDSVEQGDRKRVAVVRRGR